MKLIEMTEREALLLRARTAEAQEVARARLATMRSAMSYGVKPRVALAVALHIERTDLLGIHGGKK